MSSVQEIETAIEKLTPQEARQIANWLAHHLPKTDLKSRRTNLRRALGIWKDRTDLPDIRAMRRQFDRF